MDFNKPGPNKRVCAFFIDAIIAHIFAGTISFLLGKNVNLAVWSVAMLLKDCRNGQSAGKYLTGTQILDENNLPAGPFKTILRNVFMVIPLFALVEYFIMLRDKEQARRIGDLAAKTRVNDLKPQTKDSIFLWVSIGILLMLTVLQICISVMAMLIKDNPAFLKR